MNRKKTRKIRVGTTWLGGTSPILIQSMCATKTRDIEATSRMAQELSDAGGGLIRIAVDTPQDAQALKEIRQQTTANLSVDLQENYRLAEQVAPYVDKIRYNPGHLHHLDASVPWQKKVEWLAKIAADHDCALRIGINCGSLDPLHRKSSALKEKSPKTTQTIHSPQFPLLSQHLEDLFEKSPEISSKISSKIPTERPTPPFSQAEGEEKWDPLLASALEHADFLESIGFTRFCVSIKDSDPWMVVQTNRRFSQLRPEIPLHLGVTEAGMPPMGILKSRLALETLLAEGIGDTLRVSLTVPNAQKREEIEAGQLILQNVAAGNRLDWSVIQPNQLNIVSCPSCSRVQNETFVTLAQQVRQATEFAQNFPIKIAVMGCRVNGPGETDDADLGLWCGPDHVNLKDGANLLGAWPYDQIIEKMLEVLRKKIASLQS